MHGIDRRRAGRSLVTRLPILVASVALVSTAIAGPAEVTDVVAVSETSSSPLGRCRDGPEQGTKFLNSEVEPQVAVDPTDPARIAVAYQQDRWSNGGARGVVTAISNDGGSSWQEIVRTKTSFCTGGRVRNGGDFERATDPWVTFTPNGRLYLMTLSLNQSDTDHAMLVTKFKEKRGRWGKPTALIRESPANFLNDKNSMTADPNEPDGSHVYAVWDRVGLAKSRTSNPAGAPRLGVRGPTLFARTTNGGRTWEPARVVLDTGTWTQTLANQIVVSPDLDDGVNEGQLVNAFMLIHNLRRQHSVAVIHSFDQGETWSDPTVVDRSFARGVIDPDPDSDRLDAIRAGTLIPDVAVDPATGNLYAVRQDSRFNDFDYDGIVFSQSTDGGMTWSSPTEINKTPDVSPVLNRQAFTPTVEVAADGTIGVTYYDFRSNTADLTTLETDYWIVHCHPTSPTRCTNASGWDESGPVGGSFDMKAAPYARGYFTGDYQGLAATTAGFIAIFSRGISTADPATVHAGLVSAP